MSEIYDAIIISAGHNGLVTAGYLARAGQKVLVLERRNVVGGACVTEEVWPGYKVSTLSYLCSLLMRNIVEDLELRRFGYHIYPNDPAFVTAFPDGRHIFFWADAKKNMEEISKFSKKDAEYLPQYEHELERLAQLVEELSNALARSAEAHGTVIKTGANVVVSRGRTGLQCGSRDKKKGKILSVELVN